MLNVEIESNLGPLDLESLVKAAIPVLQEAAKRVITDFRSVTATWEHRPTFTTYGPLIAKGELYIEVGPTGPHAWLFALVSAGAKPHRITAKNAPMLRFRTGYRAKTKPLSFVSVPGGKEGPYRRKRSVQHPGFAGRQFGVAALDKHSSWWAKGAWQVMEKWSLSPMGIRPMRRINI